MNKTSYLALLLMGLSLPLFGACNRTSGPTAGSSNPSASQPAVSDNEPQTVLGKTVAGAIDKARHELETGNIDLNDGPVIRVGNSHRVINASRSNLPKARITPQGDLVIADKAVAITPHQRELLLAYRQQVIDIAETGMSIGVQGADLAGKAVTGVLGSVFSGKGDEFGKRMDVEGKKLEAKARQLCTQLEPMRLRQQQLAASLPEFKPYATMTDADIDECDKHGSSVTTQ